MNIFKILTGNLHETLDDVKEQLLFFTLIAINFLGLPIVIIASIEAVMLNHTSTAIVYAICFLPMVIVSLLRKRISYFVIIIIIILFFYILGVHNLIVYGFSGAAIPLFFTLLLFTTIFLDIYKGLAAILLCLMPMLIVGYLFVNKILYLSVTLNEISTYSVSWITASATLIFLGGFIVICIGVIQKKLLYNLKLQNEQTNELTKNNVLLREKEDKLQEREKFLSTIIENIPNMIFVKDAKELQFVRFNKAGEELLGCSREELIGKSDHDIFSEEEADFFSEMDRAVLSSGKLIDIPEESIQTKDKGKRILHTRKIPILNEEGMPQYLLGISEDITERKQAEKTQRDSTEKHTAMIENIGDVIAIIGADGMTKYQSPNIYKLFGWKPENLLGKTVWNNVHPEDIERVQKEFSESFKKEESAVVEFRYKCKDGNYKWIETTGVNRINEPAINGLLLNTHDITERKQAVTDLFEAQEKTRELLEDSDYSRKVLLSMVEDQKITERKLEETLGSMEKQVLERTSELSLAREEAVNANKAKSIFLSSMSHEIRTPLNAILGFSHILLREKNIPQKVRERLTTINRSGEHLLNLINDVLDLSKIEAGYMTFNAETFNFITMLKDIESMIKVRAESKDLQLSFDLSDNLPLYIITDERKLRQIIINILGNAIKFTTKGSVDIRVYRGPEDGDMIGLFIDVEDTGPGLSVDDIKNLFNAFSQTQTGAKAGGTGLGLALSMQYANLMDGNIAVESEKGKGSCFTISLNVKEAKDKPSSEKANQQCVIGLKSSEIFRVLVVDDNEDNRLLISDILKPLGFQIKDAINGREAIELFQSWMPHLILMDMRMPVMSGYDAILHIRNLKEGKTIPIIAVTASAFEEDREKVINWGADGYLRKPFKDYEIYDCLKTFLGIEYVYEDNNIESVSNGSDVLKILSPNVLKDLSDDIIEAMLQASLKLDQDRLVELLDQLKEKNPGIVESLLKLVKSYQYDRLIEVFENRKGV